MQTYSYFKRYPLDKTFYKLLVRSVALCVRRRNSTQILTGCFLVRTGCGSAVRMSYSCLRSVVLTAVDVCRLIELADQALISHAVYTYLVRYVPVPP